jgi:hypothetical protein
MNRIQERTVPPSNLFLISLALGLAFPSLANAQEADAGAPIGSQGRPPKYQIQVNGSAADKSAKISVDLLRAFNSPKISGDRLTVSNNESSLNFTMSTPWDGENDALPASLDGLASGATASMTYAYHFTRINRVATQQQDKLLQKAEQICRSKAGEERTSLIGQLGPNPNQSATEAVEKAIIELLKTCDKQTAQRDILVNTYLTAREARAYTVGSFASAASSLAITGSIGQKKFEFVDPTSLATDAKKHVSWSLGASFTLYPRDTPTAVSFSAKYERAYKAAESKILCPAPNGLTPVTCVNKPVGTPNLDKSYLLGATVRHRFWQGEKLGVLAIAPSATYDTSNDIFGAELPVYFVPSKDGGLTGGLKLGYRSDTDNVSFGIFLGAAFGIVN